MALTGSASSPTPNDRKRSLADLPVELLMFIFQQLGIQDMISLSETCRTLNRIVNGVPAVKLEQAAAGFGLLQVEGSRDPFRFLKEQESQSEDQGEDAFWLEAQDPTTEYVLESDYPGLHLRAWRPTVPPRTVPWPAGGTDATTPPPLIDDIHPLRKLQSLQEREARWDCLNPAVTRRIKVETSNEARLLQSEIGLFDLKGPCREILDLPLPTANDPELKFRPHIDTYTPVNMISGPIEEMQPFWPHDPDVILVDREQLLAVIPIYLDSNGMALEASTSPTSSAGIRYDFVNTSFTNHMYPLSSVPGVTMPYPPEDLVQRDAGNDLKVTSISAQVMGSTFLAFVSWSWIPTGDFRHSKYLFHAALWNWRTGALMGQLFGHPSPLDMNNDAAIQLLTPTTVLIASGSKSLSLWDRSDQDWENNPSGDWASPPAHVDPSLQIWSFTPDPNLRDTTHYATCVAELGLPRFGKYSRIDRVLISPSNPLMKRAEADEYLYDAPAGDRWTPFMRSPRQGIICVTLCAHVQIPKSVEHPKMKLYHPFLYMRSHRLFLRRELLIGLAEAGEERLRRAYEVSSDHGPQHPSTSSGQSQHQPCKVPNCFCDGLPGGLRVTLAPGQTYESTTEGESDGLGEYTGISGNSVYRRYPWKAWGEENSSLAQSLACHRYEGYRGALLGRMKDDFVDFVDEGTTRHGLCVIDFNPATVARLEEKLRECGGDAGSGSGSGERGDKGGTVEVQQPKDQNQTHFKPEVLPQVSSTNVLSQRIEVSPGVSAVIVKATNIIPNCLFPDGVTTRMPFQHVWRRLPIKGQVARMDAERILIISEPAEVDEDDDDPVSRWTALALCF